VLLYGNNSIHLQVAGAIAKLFWETVVSRKAAKILSRKVCALLLSAFGEMFFAKLSLHVSGINNRK
jgi:hypothetical protein